MDHSMDSGSSADCKISMLWNWYTVDACFLSSSWHIENDAMFAATCIGVILLGIIIELSRRMGKEYDAMVIRQFHRQAAAYTPALAAKGCAGGTEMVAPTVIFRATMLQQATRALLHAVTFGGAYITMLLAMYFNGYIIISIFIGAGLGKFLCDWLVVKVEIDRVSTGSGDRNEASGIQETTQRAQDYPKYEQKPDDFGNVMF